MLISSSRKAMMMNPLRSQIRFWILVEKQITIRLIGGALSSLCRNAQRTLDTVRLAELSKELEQLSISSGDQKWMMKRAHMNAEMWRLIGNMERAEAFYNESMRD